MAYDDERDNDDNVMMNMMMIAVLLMRRSRATAVVMPLLPVTLQTSALSLAKVCTIAPCLCTSPAPAAPLLIVQRHVSHNTEDVQTCNTTHLQLQHHMNMKRIYSLCTALHCNNIIMHRDCDASGQSHTQQQQRASQQNSQIVIYERKKK